MKRSSLLQCIIGALLAFTFSVSTVGQLVTGLNLTDSVSWCIPLCAVFSLVCAALFYFKYGWCAVLLISAGAGYRLYRNAYFAKQLSSLAYKLTFSYNKVYGTGIIGETKVYGYKLLLLVIAFLTAAAVSFAVCRRRQVWTALVAAVLPFAVLLPVKLNQPDALYTYLSMAGIAVLLITDYVRKKDPKHFASFTLRASAVTAAALALLFILNPQEDYINRVGKLNAKLESIFGGTDSYFGAVINGSSSGSYTADKIDLRILGPKNDTDYEVMTVKSTFSGIVYLRGRDYDIYNGTAWLSSEGRTEKALKGRGVRGTLTVTTKHKEKNLYLPYYTDNLVSLINGYVKNEHKEKEYSFLVAEHPIGYPYTYNVSYTELSAETLGWAQALASSLTAGKRYTADKAAAIAEYVKNCATYDTKTTSMMNKGDDFAKWFLYESETGYCAHYATAATVLLRAAGIPARYVEGYYVQCVWDEEVSVSNRRAHAWAEYFDASANTWHVLEATPAEALVWDTAVEDDPPQTEPPVTEAPVTDEPAVTDEPPVTDAPQTTEPQIPDDIGDIGGNDDKGKEKTPLSVPKWAKWLLWTALALAVIILQASIRITAKHERWNLKNPNSAALARWKQCEFSAKMTQTAIPDKLEDIALKAKFSQHTVSGQELAEFEAFRKKLLAKVNKMPWYKKLVMRLVFAIG